MAMTNQEKLISVRTELVILKSRLTEPYRANMDTCITYLQEVEDDLNGNDKEGL
jgi:hypothetical protein